LFFIYFFFSSRRRHTRWPRDWSSDVCSSDLAANRECQVYDKGFDPASLRRAIAAYFGLVSFIDHNVGRLMEALAETGLAAETREIGRASCRGRGENAGGAGA